MKRHGNLFYEYIWECYIRKNNSNIVDTKGFVEKSNCWNKIIAPARFWCADPFLIDYNGRHFVFCELMDRYKSKGYIGAGEIKSDGTVTIDKVLELECHTSYPDVFCYDNEWFMIPESSGLKEVSLYKAVSFPDKWEKVGVLLSDINAVDSTVFSYENKLYIIIYIECADKNTMKFGELVVSGCSIENLKTVKTYNSKTGRPGGGIIKTNEQIFRPTQYGVHYYGEKIIFKKLFFDPMTFDYRESDLLTIDKEMVKQTIGIEVEGVHTYNADSEYEVIDIYRKKFFVLRPAILFFKFFKIGGFKFGKA